MENASKALLIAGGMLIALLIIGALVLMFNQIGDYEKGKQGVEKNSQIAEFNMDFVRYTDDKGITGADVVSLINKVIDYNNRAKNGGVNNSVDYNIKMEITVSELDKFNSKYSYSGDNKDKLFRNNEYTIGNDYNKLNNLLKEDLDNFISAENTGIPKETLKQLAGMYDKKDEEESKRKIKGILMKLDSTKYADWDGTTIPTIESIKKYIQYSEFKSSTFVTSKDPVYKNGQIQHLYFKFEK